MTSSVLSIQHFTRFEYLMLNQIWNSQLYSIFCNSNPYLFLHPFSLFPYIQFIQIQGVYSASIWQLLPLLTFPRPNRKSSGERQLNIFLMPKTILQTRDPTHGTRKIHKIQKQVSREGQGTRLTQKYDQFFDFLKDLHCNEGRRHREDEEQQKLNEVTQEVLAFFNFSKNYSEQELGRQVIYLANLLNVLGNGVKELKFEKEFKVKIRRFLTHLLSDSPQSKARNSKMQALLYILAILIFKERIDEVRAIREFNHVLYSDRCFVRQLLSITLAKYKKMDKFYGVVMVHLSNQSHGKKIKEEIVRATLRNLPKVEHEATYFNFLVLLRNEKNKIKISVEDVLEGNIINMLANSYQRYIHQHQSYYILDYLSHLLTLFPCLASQIPDFFIAYLLESSSLVALHHPLHECTIINFVQLALKFSETQAKSKILMAVYGFLLTNRPIALKLAHIIIEYEINEEKMMELLENGYFRCFLELINLETDQHLLNKTVEVFKKIAEKFQAINNALSQYLKYQLSCRLKVIQDRRRGVLNEAM